MLVAPEGTLIRLSAENPTDTNSITEPTKIVPVTSKATGLGNTFTQTFAPLSINVLQIETK
jgi:alpha-N-arabinofuranosidase